VLGNNVTLTINEEGKVGVGTTNPQVQLDVSGTGSFGQLDVSGTGSFGGDLTVSSRAGIGLTDPQVQLDVAGTRTGGKSLQLRSGDSAGGVDATQIIFSYDGKSYNNQGYAHSIKTRHHAGQEVGNAIDFYVWDHGDDTDTELGTKRVMTLDGNGNVGIGTEVPGKKLTVDGDIGFITDGQGIDFGNSTGGAAGSVASAVLDDYEEGTWTPQWVGSSTAGTASGVLNSGAYTKIGNLCTIRAVALLTGHTGTGDLLLQGLPYNVSDSDEHSAVAIRASLLPLPTGQTYLSAYLDAGSEEIKMYGGDVAGNQDAVQVFNGLQSIIITSTYTVY
jgi:hypothetical protein